MNLGRGWLIAALAPFAFLSACGGATSPTIGTPPPLAADAPSIATQPVNQSVLVGDSATFSVVATGTEPLSYQWKKGGADIAGATEATYTTPATTIADNDSTFLVVVTNAVGSQTSDSATLTVTAAATPPVITKQPSDQTVTVGQSATFSVSASGTASLTYQWKKNGAAIAGATAATYVTPATVIGDDRSAFLVVVSNGVGSATSSPATLTVSAVATGPIITAQPTNQTVTVGETASFSVTATGSAPLSYQWKKNGSDIAGATGATYTTPATAIGDNASSFLVVVTNSVGSVTSSTATLTVSAVATAPVITVQPGNRSVTVGQTANFSVTATGSAPLTYQWKKDGTAIAGATAANYTTPATVIGDNARTFLVVVTNSVGSTTSSSATLTVSAIATAPVITGQPTNQTVTVGQTATFSVTATGSAPLSYQWKKSGTAIVGATSAAYTTPATVIGDNASTFLVVVTNGVGSLTSSSATLTVSAAATGPVITAQPSNQSVTVGQTAMFSVTATGSAPLSYQWKKNGTAIAGAAGATYTTPATVIGDNASTFLVVVSNSVGSLTSSSATLTVSAAATGPVITAQPSNQSVTEGQTATFSVTTTGTPPLTYQWRKSGTTIAGATASTYTTPATVIGDTGSTFLVVVSNAVGSQTSTSATLTVTAAATAPTITTQPSNQSVNVGQTATFSVTATGSAPLSYQWKKNGTAIAGATAATYVTPAAVIGDNASTFLVVVTNSVGTQTSSGATLTVNAVATVGTDVSTYKNDLSRTGQNLTESNLTLANVNSAAFGLLRKLPVDSRVDAQPLYLSQLTISGAVHNVVFVATERDSVYAFDADTGTVLWQVSLLGTGESPSNDHGCGQVTPDIGVTSTPVIDRHAGAHGVMYVVAMSMDAGTNYHQRLHAIDITTGAELLSGPTEITAAFTAKNAHTSTFDPGFYEERAALTLSNGVIYTTWTSHCDAPPYGGWIIAYSQSTLASAGALNVAANSNSGPAIWMSGGGPAVDSAGNIYLLTANGAFETTMDAQGFPNQQDFGNSFLKISPAGSGLGVLDYFTMSNEVAESNADQDLGSGGEMLLPDLVDANQVVRHLVIGAGKDGNIYLVDRDSMGKFNSSSNNIFQFLNNVLPGGIWATPAYFNGAVYYGATNGTMKAFSLSNAKLIATPQSQSATQFTYPGTAPSVSANGTANGIVWAHENSSPAVLHAYDASNLAHELYNSNQAAAARDQFGSGNKYITPTVADGKVFVGTANSVAVFGLLP
jgi:hypothetical protein